MKRYTLFFSLFLLCSIYAEAQTAKKFTINLTDGGKSHVVCFLPEKPSGKAIVWALWVFRRTPCVGGFHTIRI